MLRVCSFYHLCDSDESEWDTFIKNVEIVNATADIKPLASGTKAEFLHGTILDQMSDLGCPTWRSPDLTTAPNHINVFVLNIDAGGDIAKCGRNILAEVESLAHVVVIAINCLMHQYHLAIRSALNAIESVSKRIFLLNPGYWRRVSTRHHYCKLRLSCSCLPSFTPIEEYPIDVTPSLPGPIAG